jgi:hypothetical protein
MFNWFFGNRANSHFYRFLIRCENILKDIKDCKKLFQRINIRLSEEDNNNNPVIPEEILSKKINRELKSLHKKLSKDIFLSKESEDLILNLEKDLTDMKKEIDKIEEYLNRTNLLKELGEMHIIIKVINRKFTNFRAFMIDIENLEKFFERLLENKTSLKSINAVYFHKKVSDKIHYLYKNIDHQDLENKYSITNEVELFLKEYIVALKEIKSYLNTFWYEYQLLKRLCENHEKGKRGSELITSVFGKNQSYDFNKRPQNRTDLINNFIFTMKKTLSEDEINRIMNRLRYKLVKDSDFLTRGISDNEAKIFASTISELSGPIGIRLEKNNSPDGYGFVHAGEHHSELIDVVYPKFNSIKDAIEDTVKNPKFKITSGDSWIYLNPVGNDGRYFLIAIMNPIIGFVTFYHADDSGTKKGFISSLPRMLTTKTNIEKIFRYTDEEDHYLFYFYNNYYFDIQKKNNRTYISAKRGRVDESRLQLFNSNKNRRKIANLIKEITEKNAPYKIDLMSLAA